MLCSAEELTNALSFALGASPYWFSPICKNFVKFDRLSCVIMSPLFFMTFLFTQDYLCQLTNTLKK